MVGHIYSQRILIVYERRQAEDDVSQWRRGRHLGELSKRPGWRDRVDGRDEKRPVVADAGKLLQHAEKTVHR
jgi:hypothetical protein